MSDMQTANRLNNGWEHFSHTADIGVRGFGSTAAGSFEQAALAMTAVVSDLESIHPEVAVHIHREAPDIELLFVDWLNAVIFEMATREMLFCEYQVTIEGNVLNGWARGEHVDAARHKPAAEIKGATFSELGVKQLPDGVWCAQCIVDI